GGCKSITLINGRIAEVVFVLTGAERLCGAWRKALICSPIFQYYQNSLADDVQIEPQRPVAQIIEIMIDARLHLVQGSRLSAVAVDLRPTRNSRLYLVPDHVAFYKIAIYLVVRYCMRPGTDNAHAPLQSIDELRQFVEGILPQESPDTGYASI